MPPSRSFQRRAGDGPEGRRGGRSSSPGDSILIPREFFNLAGELLPTTASAPVEELSDWSSSSSWSPPSRWMRWPPKRTGRAPRRAVSTTKATILQGEAILRANQAVTGEDMERLTGPTTTSSGGGGWWGKGEGGPWGRWRAGRCSTCSCWGSTDSSSSSTDRRSTPTSAGSSSRSSSWRLFRGWRGSSPATTPPGGFPSPATFVALATAVLLCMSGWPWVWGLQWGWSPGHTPPSWTSAYLITTTVGGAGGGPLSVRAVSSRRCPDLVFRGHPHSRGVRGSAWWRWV